jgi:ATF/CREB family transcription factor
MIVVADLLVDQAKANPDSSAKADAITGAEPLAPPPRPSGNNEYFATAQAPQASHLSYEPNPFEHSFANGSSDPTSGTKLPSVAALTSPASLLPGGGTTPFWGSGSLRTGPLSPAMLSGPTGDYFTESHHLRGGFPTPNESSMRTGLTPGGGGSMFPAPSPSANALFSQLAGGGGATPSTIDFHRTAMNAQKLNNNRHEQPSVTSQPQDLINGIENKSMQNQQPTEMNFGQHDANDAANGLFMLASQSRNGPQNGAQYAPAPQQPVHAHPQTNMGMNHSANQSPTMANRNNGSMSTASGRDISEMSGDESDQARPNTRGKGKKGAATNGRRKGEESKGPASKKAKANNGNSMSLMEPEPQSEEEPDLSKDEYNANGKKMTDEEKRKNFLERNR